MDLVKPHTRCGKCSTHFSLTGNKLAWRHRILGWLCGVCLPKPKPKDPK